MSTTSKSATRRSKASPAAYVLDAQVGFILRQVVQRHTILFGTGIGEDLTSTQWAALAKLHEIGPCSQNLLGRLTAMDAATIKGVVDRMVKRGFVETRPDPEDGRRLVAVLTADGQALVERTIPAALAVTQETLAPLNAAERAQFVALLSRLK